MIAGKAKKREPHIGMVGPDWWHHHGSKMHLKESSLPKDIIGISGSAAHVVIKGASAIRSLVKGWFVSWVVRHSFYESSEGQVWFDDKELASAFGIIEESGRFGQWIIDRYGGEVAEQGKFIRWKNYLNIPCPGTGHDGDPNVSIELDDEIKKAVHILLGQFA